MRLLKCVFVVLIALISATQLIPQQDAVLFKTENEASPGTKVIRMKLTTNTSTARARVLITQADLAFDTTTGVLILPSTDYASTGTGGYIRYDSSNHTLKYYDGSVWHTVSTGAAGGAVGGTGTSPLLAYWTGSTTIASAADLYWDTTNNRLGIGTTSPACKLDVIGSLRATGPAVLGPDTTTTGTLKFMELSANGSNCVSFKAPDNIAADVVWTLPSSTGSAGQVLSVGANGVLTWVDLPVGLPAGTAGQTLRHDGTNWVANSTIFNDGTNVGIGTTTPGQKLTVAGGNISIVTSGKGILFPDGSLQTAAPRYKLTRTKLGGALSPVSNPSFAYQYAQNPSQNYPQNTLQADNNWGWIYGRFYVDAYGYRDWISWTWDFGSLRTGVFEIKWRGQGQFVSGAGSEGVRFWIDASQDNTNWTNIASPYYSLNSAGPTQITIGETVTSGSGTYRYVKFMIKDEGGNQGVYADWWGYVDYVRFIPTTLTVKNLIEGQKVELYDSANNLKASGTVAENATSVTLNTGALLNFTGYFRIYDVDGTTLLYTSPTYTDINGDSVWIFRISLF